MNRRARFRSLSHRKVDMKKGVEYRDVAKEIVTVLAKYETTVADIHYILGWLNDEIAVQPIQEPAD